MTHLNFNSLDRKDQYTAILENGVYLMERKEASIKYLLFQIENFYVEVRCTADNTIKALESFYDVDELEPYLNQIDISKVITSR